MSIGSYFHMVENDIVTLKTDDDMVGGWVNVGVHAVWIELDDGGNLRVEAYAREQEDDPLDSIFVLKNTAVACGGVDPDEGEDE